MLLPQRPSPSSSPPPLQSPPHPYNSSLLSVALAVARPSASPFFLLCFLHLRQHRLLSILSVASDGKLRRFHNHGQIHNQNNFEIPSDLREAFDLVLIPLLKTWNFSLIFVRTASNMEFSGVEIPWMEERRASPGFTDVFAALVAVVNTKFPEVGNLLLTGVVLQLKRAYKRNDKPQLLAATKFIAHLVNQLVAHEIVALELLTMLLENLTDDSVEG